MRTVLVKVFFLLAFVQGSLVLASLLWAPSEAGVFLGYSLQRWFLIGGVGVALCLSAVLAFRSLFRAGFSVRVWQRLDQALNGGSRLLPGLAVLITGGVFLLGGWLFSYLFIPVHLRWILFWLALTLVQAAFTITVGYWHNLNRPGFFSPLEWLPRWRNLDALQRKTFWLLFLVGSAYFLAFTIPNALDAMDAHMLYLRGGDENITYPYVVWMLTPGDRLETAVYRLFVYEDYHYGYPFYFLSMLALLPVRLLGGPEFGSLTQVNLLLLRQLISVLPMVLSAGMLVYLQTRFRRPWQALALFLVILLLPAVLRYNVRFWHPDGLVVLCVTLTIFFLDRDRLALKGNFLLAAFLCGMASAIKLYGFFFFFSIAGYLAAALWARRTALRGTVVAAAGFLVIMFGTLVLSNPFVFVREARERLAWIMEVKAQEVRAGYDEPDPEQVYQKGLAAALPAVVSHYGPAAVQLFLLAALAAAALSGGRRTANGVALGWFVTAAAYLVWFVAIKNYHYYLPTMIPLYSAFFGLQEAAAGVQPRVAEQGRRLASVAGIAGWVMLAYQVGWSILQAAPLWLEWGRIGEFFS